jgi:upstream activation factor subunit UAF30
MATKKKGGAKKSTAKKGSAKKASAKKASAKKGGARKAAAKTARKSARKSAAPRKKRAPNPAFMRPMQPDEALGAVVGSSAMPRTEITKKLWAYIRKNGLQDAKERRMINADDKLGRVFGGKKQVSMFEMTKLVNKHIK